MSEAVVVAIVTTVGLVVVAIISNRTRQHAKAARDQVQNSHSTNLRDELDNRHEENVGKLDDLLDWQKEHTIEAKGAFARIGRLELLVLPAIVLAIAATGATILRRFMR